MSSPEEDTDPTGMRELLRALPDPGPMPDDLTARIRASLAELHVDAGAGGTPGAGADGTGSAGRSSITGSVGPSWWVRHARHVAVASVVVVGGGAAAAGSWELLGRGDAASTASDAGTDSGTATTEEDRSAAPEGSELTGGATERLRRGPVTVRASGRDYAVGALPILLDRAAGARSLAPNAAEAPSIGPIGTEIGVRSCLEGLGLDPGAGADVDVATVDGAPAAVIVLTTSAGVRTAYAVRRDCSHDNPALIAGPVQGR